MWTLCSEPPWVTPRGGMPLSLKSHCDEQPSLVALASSHEAKRTLLPPITHAHETGHSKQAASEI